MTKKIRSPPKQTSSPNPRPKQRTKQPSTLSSPSRMQDINDDPHTPDRMQTQTNSFAALENETSDDSETESVYESAGEESPAMRTKEVSTPSASLATAQDMTPPEKIDHTAKILPTDEERLSTSPVSKTGIRIPRLAPKLLGKKAPPVASLQQENQAKVPADPVKTLNKRIDKTKDQLQELNSSLSQLKAAGLTMEDVAAVAMDVDDSIEPTPDASSFQAKLIKDIQLVSQTLTQNPPSVKPVNVTTGDSTDRITTSMQIDEGPTSAGNEPPPNPIPAMQRKQAPRLVEVLNKPSELKKPPTQSPDLMLSTRPVYPDLPPPHPLRKNFFRASWKIDIPKSAANPEEGVIDAITEVWLALKQVDSKLIIYPWKEADKGKWKPLSDPSKIPQRKDPLTRYFKDAYFRPHPGPMYVRVYMGFDISDEELGKHSQAFFQSSFNKSRVGFWKSRLQYEDITDIGWLYCSTPGMSDVTLEKEIFRHTGIKVAARWKLISLDLKGKLPDKLLVRAWHLSVRTEDAALAKINLTRKIFAKHRSSHFIGGSPMRLIPICKNLSAHNKGKIADYVSYQSSFLKNIDFAISWEILNIDEPTAGLNNRSLREIILEIPLRDEPSRQAFLSVERNFNDGSVRFYFYKAHNSECRSRISSLLPFLIFTRPSLAKGIRSCFSGDAVQRAQGVKWDAENQEIITADDEMLTTYDPPGDDEEDPGLNPSLIQEILFDFQEVGFYNLPGSKMTAIKVLERDHVSLFSQSINTKVSNQDNGSLKDDGDELNSDDTPKTINKSSTLDTAAVSTITSSDLQARFDKACLVIQSLTKLIPHTPENKEALDEIKNLFSTESNRAGNSNDSSHDPGASGSRAKPR